MSKCRVAYVDLHGIIPWRSCDFEYWILPLVIITAQICPYSSIRQISVSYEPGIVPIKINLATGEHRNDDIGQSCLFRIAFSIADKPRRIALCSLLACLERFYFVFAS
ncbi:hypothetical protein ACN38_g3575 [Penicillium nordicum]|uniref:Uncharacterized protein n=1 Tax=Penicillium nordicum TaxID=229535 RepID=A0A0M8PCR9_9EURO|nr:hypothetical protein ACN38_g3575 [Penicillium nordicum]